jgi:hypothetical protein
VFDDDNPEEAKVEKSAALLLFLNMNKGKENINKHKDLKNKLYLTASTAITDLMIKKSVLGK